MHNKKTAKVVSFVLMLSMFCTAMPLTVSAKMSETGKTIQKIENLEERFTLLDSSEMLYSLEVTPNTSLEDLKLPDVLAVTVEKPKDKDQKAEDQKEETVAPEDTLSGNQAMAENKADEDAATDSDTVTATEDISVSWTSDREYRPDAGETYLFSAQLPESYMLGEGILLPKISVSVSAGRQMRMAAPASMTERTRQLDFTMDSYKTENGVVENPTGVYSKDSEGWSYDANSNTLTLNGLNLVTTDTLALKGSGDFKIVLADNSINTITSNSKVTDSTNTISAGIDAKKLTILGNTGVLNVRGGNAYNSYGILCESIHMEGGVLKTQGGAVEDSNNDSIGLMFSQDSTVRGGSLTAVGGTCGDDQASMGIQGTFETKPDLTVTGGTVNAYTVNENTQWVGIDIAISVPGVFRIEGGTVDAKAGTALYSSIGILADSVLVTGGTLTAKQGSLSYGLGSLSAVEAKTTIEIGNNMGIYTGPDFQTPAYVSKYTYDNDPVETRFLISATVDGTKSASPIKITAKKSFPSNPPTGSSTGSSTGGSSSSQTPMAPAEPVMASVNYNGVALKSWKDIQKAMANLSAGNLKDMPEQKSSVGPLLLQVNIQNTTGYLPSGPVSEIAGKQNVGLHLFLGNGVAVTLLGQNVDASFKGTNLSNKIKKADTKDKKEYIVDFKEKGKIGAVVLLHASIPHGAKNKAAIYREDKDGSRTLLLNSEINENGSICFPIDAKEKYVIVY